MTSTPTSHDTRPGHPYQVPDGYFSDLRGTLRERISGDTDTAPVTSSSPVDGGLWGRIRGLVGISVAFGCLVLLATVGYYFTGYPAQQREQLAMQDETAEVMLGYRIYAEDIENLASVDGDDTGAVVEAGGEERQLFAQAVTEYLTTYGYEGADEIE